jgi:hypothetical protein
MKKMVTVTIFLFGAARVLAAMSWTAEECA